MPAELQGRGGPSLAVRRQQYEADGAAHAAADVWTFGERGPDGTQRVLCGRPRWSEGFERRGGVLRCVVRHLRVC